MGKLVSQEKIVQIVRQLQEENKTVVTTNGCYDILHVGHVRYLQKTKEIADYCVVMLNSDRSVKKNKGDNRPINTELDRAEILCALSCVDYVVIFDEKSPCELLDKIKPNFHTKGADYTLDTLPEEEKNVIIKNNINVKFIEFVEGKSTTNTIEKMKQSK
ncbi:MAG: adenylyltransferase/cytidyltransferase family protein [Candidatus Gastranaerophilaceae bacterium]